MKFPVVLSFFLWKALYSRYFFFIEPAGEHRPYSVNFSSMPWLVDLRSRAASASFSLLGTAALNGFCFSESSP